MDTRKIREEKGERKEKKRKEMKGKEKKGKEKKEKKNKKRKEKTTLRTFSHLKMFQHQLDKNLRKNHRSEEEGGCIAEIPG